MKLQLFCLDWTVDSELERYIAEILAPCDVEIERGLTFWQDRQLSPLALDLVAAPASITSICREGFFGVRALRGPARKRNRTSARLEQRTFLRMNKQTVFGLNGGMIDSSLPTLHEKQTQTVVKT